MTMPVYDYTNGGGPNGFRGFRVVRGVDGVQQQHYISVGRGGVRAARAAAKRLDAALAEQSERARQGRYPTATAVKGISAVFSITRGRYYPAFKVQIGPAGRVASRTVSINRYGYEGAWREAVEFYGEVRGLASVAPLIRLCPDPGQFRAIRRAMRRQGHDIPVNKLPG